MDALSFIAIFGGLFYWPIFMVFHRHWSFKAKLLFSLFATNLVVLVGFCYAWIYIVITLGLLILRLFGRFSLSSHLLLGSPLCYHWP